MKVFLSYARQDQEFARELATRLTDEGLEVWFDDWHVNPGDNVAKLTGKALDAADAMIVVISPAAAEDSRVRDEIRFALAKPRFEGLLIPVILKPADKMPWILQTMNVVRATKNLPQTVQRITDALQPAVAR